MPDALSGSIRERKESDSAKYKRIQRLAQQSKQSETAASEAKAALIDAVAALFDDTLKLEGASKRVLELSLGQRIQDAFPRFKDAHSQEKRFTFRLIFWTVYFIEHHEWLCPELTSAHPPEAVFWEWVQHFAHFYTNTLADTFRVNPALWEGLPRDLSWNLPSEEPDGSVKWPVQHGFEWLESILDDKSRDELPSIVFPYDNKSVSISCYNRMIREQNLPGLDRIHRVAAHHWNFKPGLQTISPAKLNAVLLWCRALHFALKGVEKMFDLSAVWTLAEWHERATESRF